MSNIRIIFILYNIYESISGVSTKYIKFINYLSKQYDITLFTTFNNKKIYNDIVSDNIKKNIKIIKIKGLNIPFYKEIKIPIINKKNIKKEIKNENEIIIFNGEFIWLYELLSDIKKIYTNIKLYPNMHTNYTFYCENIYTIYNFNFISTLNYLNDYLEKKIFNGIIVTGEKMKNKYLNYTEYVFNANEVNLDIFNKYKIDNYNSNSNNNIYNIIFCGRISKEKNIDEVFDCCIMLIDNNYDIIINIIGDGPYITELNKNIETKYNKLSNNIIFYGSKTQDEINDIYQKLTNRIFIYTSISETFGKTPMEACATGIPLFIKKSDITDYIYIDKKNAFIFDDKNMFINYFNSFISLNSYNKKKFILDSINNVKKYNQNDIFLNWSKFLIYGKYNQNNININLFDIFTFHGITKFINCTGTILGE
jgi:glycosyltransferase involved in cell wall biosynthesis